MKSFMEFMNILTEEDFILIESMSPVEWKQDDNTHVHKANIEGKRLTIYIDRHHHDRGMQHSVRFEVNGEMSKKKINPNIGKKVLMHVAHAVHSYTADHVKKGDFITMSGYDKNPEKQREKNTVYSAFSKRLAKVRGGTHKETRVQNAWGAGTTIHSVQL